MLQRRCFTSVAYTNRYLQANIPPIIRDKEEDKGKEDKEEGKEEDKEGKEGEEEDKEGGEEREDLIELQSNYISISVLPSLYYCSTIIPLVGRSPYYNLIVLVLSPTFSSVYPLG